MGKKELNPVHPGEVLLEEFLRPMGLSQNRLALDIGVPPRRINEIVLGKRSITADTALRLARYFGNSPQFWLGLQMHYDLDIATEALGARLKREVKIAAMARMARSAAINLRRTWQRGFFYHNGKGV
jgi:addiction module HigA family antidote